MVPFRIALDVELLTSKEVCFILKWSRMTLWRRKMEGCPFVAGRISGASLAAWLRARVAPKNQEGSAIPKWKRKPRRACTVGPMGQNGTICYLKSMAGGEAVMLIKVHAQRIPRLRRFPQDVCHA
jgi:hypothetical protein